MCFAFSNRDQFVQTFWVERCDAHILKLLRCLMNGLFPFNIDIQAIRKKKINPAKDVKTVCLQLQEKELVIYEELKSNSGGGGKKKKRTKQSVPSDASERIMIRFTNHLISYSVDSSADEWSLNCSQGTTLEPSISGTESSQAEELEAKIAPLDQLQ